MMLFSFFFGHPLLVVEEVALFVELDHGVVAAAGHRRQAEVAIEGVAAPAQDVIPDDLDALLRNREGDADDRAGHTVAALGQLGRGRHRLGRIVDALRRRGAAVGRVDVHLVRRISLEHGLLADRQLGGVLAHVVGRDGEEHLVGGIRVGMVLALLVAGRRCGDATVPGRDGAVGVAGFFAAHGGEVLAEAVGLVGRNGREALAGQEQAGHEKYR